MFTLAWEWVRLREEGGRVLEQQHIPFGATHVKRLSTDVNIIIILLQYRNRHVSVFKLLHGGRSLIMSSFRIQSKDLAEPAIALSYPVRSMLRTDLTKRCKSIGSTPMQNIALFSVYIRPT